MNTKEMSNEELAALEVLRHTGVNVLDAAIVAKIALEAGRRSMKRALECITEGKEALRAKKKTVTFERAVRVALKDREKNKGRTLSDFRYMTQRLMERCPELAKKLIRCITPQMCASYLRQAFGTPRQRNNARLILSGVFSTAEKHGWCSTNPVRLVTPEKIKEKRIKILSHEEIDRLMNVSATFKGGVCLAAVAIMLLAGVRPYECERLSWGDVRLEDGMIIISPQHSKTGGARSVTIHPPLARILRRMKKDDHELICPPCWRRLWTALHHAAGFTKWQPDVLRHTFATHHLATFHSYEKLQVEMGHRSAALLRTRYIAMDGITRRGKSIFEE